MFKGGGRYKRKWPLMLLVVALKGQTHPHNWIDLKTEMFVNAQGELTQIDQYWEFDVDFSQATIADVFHEAHVQPDSLSMLGNDMINNMQRFDYFSKLKLADHNVPLYRPASWALEIVERENQQYLYLHMRFNFTSPVPIAGKKLHWQVYDPTYYIEMTHQDISQIVVHTEGEKCEVDLQLPQPSKALQDYSSQLDASLQEYDNDFASAESDYNYIYDPLQDYKGKLGKSFAQTLIIECPKIIGKE